MVWGQRWSALAIFHLDWPAKKKRPPQVRFDLPEMQGFEGENRTCGGLFFAGQSQWKISSLCVKKLVQSKFMGGPIGVENRQFSQRQIYIIPTRANKP